MRKPCLRVGGGTSFRRCTQALWDWLSDDKGCVAGLNEWGDVFVGGCFGGPAWRGLGGVEEVIAGGGAAWGSVAEPEADAVGLGGGGGGFETGGCGEVELRWGLGEDAAAAGRTHAGEDRHRRP